MAVLNGLPVYTINFKEDPKEKSGIDFVSLVDYPAIESNWVAFSKEDSKKPLKFAFDSDKQILYGPILIVDKPIYRYNEQTGEEFYVVFTKEVVERLVRKLQKTGKTINLNYQHLKDSQIKEAVIQELWLTGKPDKSNQWGFDLKEGSAFAGVHIGDSKFWNEEIKTGNVMGFSIEGFLDLEMKKIKQNMNTEKFITAKTDTGIEIKSDAEAFASGVEVYTEVDGAKTPCADGDYTLENGTVLKVAGGKITEITETEPELDAAQVEVVQKAAKTKEMEAELASLKTELAALKLKLENTPGAPPATGKNDQPVILTRKKALESKLSILRKKSNEVTINTK